LAIQSRESHPYSETTKTFLSAVEGLVLARTLQGEVREGEERFKRIGWFMAHDKGALNFKMMSDILPERDIMIV
jgi:hypothetical protein